MTKPNIRDRPYDFHTIINNISLASWANRLLQFISYFYSCAFNLDFEDCYSIDVRGA